MSDDTLTLTVTRVVTHTGSVYEFDEANKRVRRMGLEHEDQTRASPEWRPYEEILVVTLGAPMVIRWPDDVGLLEGSPEDAVPTTETSPVVAVEFEVQVDG